MRLRRLLPVLPLAAAIGAATGHAQTAGLPRYAPELGRMVRTLTELRTTATLVGFPAVPDGATTTTETWLSATQRVTAFEREQAIVDVTMDSVRGRTRVGTEPWVDRADTQLVGRTAQAVVSPHFGIVGIRSSHPTDADVLQPLGAFVAGLGFAFPDSVVPLGTPFPTGGRFRVRVQTGPETGLPFDDVAVGDLALVLDSVTAGAGDELSYFTFRGSFPARTAAAASESGDVVTTLSGAFAGRLVWSAAWNAFVSAAVRVRVDGLIRMMGPAGADEAQATWDRTILHQIRP